MKRFETRVAIRATPEALWALLTDAPGYASWNTTVDRVEGTIAKGAKVTVHAKISPGRAFPVKVEVLDAPKRMVWGGGMPLGLFRGERVFTLEPRADGSTEFAMREDFSGLLSSMITRSMPDLQPAFDEFAASLKRRAEGGS